MQRTEATMNAFDGAQLFTRRWVPDDATPKAAVLLVHGVCEHSGRYERVAEALTGAGYALASFDLRGHGRSSGRRGDARLAPTMRDIGDLLARERERTPSGKVFMYGQSLGGLFTLAYVLDRAPALAGVVVSAPVLHTALRRQPLKIAVAKTLGRFLPSLGMRPGLDDTKLMRDDAVLADRRRDSLVIDRVTLGLARDVLATTDQVLRDCDRFPAPLLVIHGRDDEVNFSSGSEELISKVKGDRTLHLYDGVLHHPHNDPERHRIFADVVAWLDQHV
jgi:acylglycerol lipase